MNKVSFNNIDRKEKKKHSLGEEIWIAVQYKTTYHEGGMYVPLGQPFPKHSH